ncbi:prostaglandin reductase 1-like [Zootermopsis nevadensis]|uniref:Prostaglandin reductase 1 n=1 Tax=Zootermopsis nevadensis TaxID=136037 RepID=A0A067RU96_ZOONE|nr:prostaglandin reductase 1-like [Zootermopsis nevadensis]KDR24385.1 Prostaglandin reductase 1 [Zootermopsis nevadensis]
MVKTKKYILAKHFVGEPKEDDFEVVEEELPPLKKGEILCEAVWLSVDPYMRPYSVNFPTGTTMIGSQVARVIESQHPEYKVGIHIVGHFGWQTKSIINIDNPPTILWMSKPFIIPDFSGLPLSLALGVLGMPGNTAYFGFLEICKPKPGETVVVSGAAGAVGSHVGQLAKIKGCKVIGFAGSDDKVKWLKNNLKFDAAFNYKTTDITKALKEAAPDGIDCYFDNVGGTLSSAIIAQMRERGRISVCGSISSYNEDYTKLPLAPILQPSLVFRELKMEGFIVRRWLDRWDEGINYNLQLIKEGKLVHPETVTEGFDNIAKAFIGMLRGENVGKAVVKA